MIAVKPLAPDSLYLCGTPVRIKIMTNEPGTTAGRKTMAALVGPSHFPTTRWTLVVAAADPQRKEARSALVSLCEGYGYPLYAYVRRRGYPADQAQDLTQQFFMRVLEGRYLDRADPEKGRFRAFILTFYRVVAVDRAHCPSAFRSNFCQIQSCAMKPASKPLSISGSPIRLPGEDRRQSNSAAGDAHDEDVHVCKFLRQMCRGVPLL